MLRMVFCLMFCLCIGSVFGADEAKKDSPAKRIQAASVTVKSGRSEGSGTIITREMQIKKGSKDSEVVNFILTAGHVVDDLRSVRTVITPDGDEKKVIEFKDGSVVKEYRQEGRSVGESKMFAKIVAYSDADHGDDIACLMVRKFSYEPATVTTTFKTDEMIDVGSPLLHCGSLLGQMGANSMTSGIMSQQGRLYEGKVYDQTTVPAFPGSSGGGVYVVVDGDPQYVGMITRGAGETFNLMVPVRRIVEWARELNVSWLLDTSVATPTLEEIEKLPVEINKGGSAPTRADPGVDETEFIFLDGEHAPQCWWSKEYNRNVVVP